MSKRTARLVGALIVLLSVAFIGGGAVGGWLYWDGVQLRGEQSARAELPPLAIDQIPRVFGYDYQTVEGSLTDIYPLLTPAYRQEFQRQLISQANVVGAGVLDAQRTRASVMVYMNRTVTEKDGQPVYDGSRLRVDYEKVDGKWLISYITPI